MSFTDAEFEAATERAFRADMLAKEAKEVADNARADLKEMVIARYGERYDGGTSKFHITLTPTSTYNVQLVKDKLNAKELKSVMTPQVDRKKVEALFPDGFAAGEFSKPNSPTLKVTVD